MKPAKPSTILASLLMSGAVVSLIACGGGGGGSDGPAADSSLSAGSTVGSNDNPGAVNNPVADAASDTPQQPQPPQTPPTALPALTLPATVASGSELALECGRTYAGTLNLSGKSNISIRTQGDCGKAVISPAREIGGWTPHQGNIYSAPVDFVPAQVIVDGQPLAKAHWPGKAQTWAKAESSTATSLRYALPNSDVAGATLLFKPYGWAIEARSITGYSNGSMTLTTTGNPNFDGYPLSGQVEFYVEGKLWMLDEPGEWVVSDGRLYVWAADGKSPQGRTWAAADRHGIDASNSNNITISGVSVYGAANGIHAPGATRLQVLNTDIANSSQNGIMNSGGSGLTVDGGSIRNSRHDAVAIKWGGGGETIRNLRVDAAGTVGMPVNAHAAINLTDGSGARVSGNTVTNSGYIGIRSYRDSIVADNTVDGACLTLTDCGGIFMAAPDGTALNARIERNTVRNAGIGQKLGWGIYLSDGANGVSVTGNTLSGNGNGMQIFDGHDNSVSGNTFSASGLSHVQMAETVGGRVRRNSFSDNRFSSRNGEETYRISSDAGVSSVQQFGSYDRNQYTSSSAVFANFNGDPLNYQQWKTRSGQDASSVFSAQ